MRLVETRGLQAKVRLLPDRAGATICETDLMEWQDQASQEFAGPVELCLQAFEIRTFKVNHGQHTAS